MQSKAKRSLQLQFWGIICWEGSKPILKGSAPSQWMSLLPKIKKLASEGNEHTRPTAIKRLRQISEERGFRAARASNLPDKIAGARPVCLSDLPL